MDFPEGDDFLRRSRGPQVLCEVQTNSYLTENDHQARLVTKFGNLLSLLYRMSICHWGCHGGSHLVEYQCGRAVNSAVASYRLIRLGYYDESLSISRNLFELANLFYLFLVSPDELANWLKLTGAKRKRQFSPVNIRLKLENLDEKAVFDADYYGAISDRMVHANPDTLPGAHNPEGRPIVGSLFQAEGWLASTHALFLAVGTFAGSAAKISAQKNIHMKKVVDASIDLVETV